MPSVVRTTGFRNFTGYSPGPRTNENRGGETASSTQIPIIFADNAFKTITNEMNDPIEIRAYEPADKEAVMELIRLNTPEYFAPEEEAEFCRYLDREREWYYVLLFRGTIVGCGGINFADDGTTGKISWDMLHPAYQGRSFGKRLLAYRIKKLESLGTVRKITVRTSQAAYRFYEKQGFELNEIRKDYWAEGFDLYRMEYKAPK